MDIDTDGVRLYSHINYGRMAWSHSRTSNAWSHPWTKPLMMPTSTSYRPTIRPHHPRFQQTLFLFLTTFSRAKSGLMARPLFLTSSKSKVSCRSKCRHLKKCKYRLRSSIFSLELSWSKKVVLTSRSSLILLARLRTVFLLSVMGQYLRWKPSNQRQPWNLAASRRLQIMRRKSRYLSCPRSKARILKVQSTQSGLGRTQSGW